MKTEGVQFSATAWPRAGAPKRTPDVVADPSGIRSPGASWQDCEEGISTKHLGPETPGLGCFTAWQAVHPCITHRGDKVIPFSPELNIAT